MLRFTLETDPEYKILENLSNHIKEVASYVNNEANHRDRLQKVVDISNRLINQDVSTFE